jgi:signal transduction histidine kinase
VAARAELARTNAELEAARELLAERSRAAERLRISRELHDGLGHHLTALRLQLEVAAHVGDGRSAAPVAQAREIAGRILDDLRRAVRELREEPPVDLASALGRLADGIPRPAIHLTVPDRLAVGDPVRANALLRSVQELVTNAVRHSGAENLWLEVGRRDGWLEVAARDDGAGSARFAPGSGLAGLRERIEGLGGGVEIDPAPGEGFRARLRIPAAAGGPPGAAAPNAPGSGESAGRAGA